MVYYQVILSPKDIDIVMGGSRISEKGVYMYKRIVGFALQILCQFS